MTNRDNQKPAKRSYQPPTLKSLGKIEQLTTGGTAMMMEMGGPPMMMGPITPASQSYRP